MITLIHWNEKKGQRDIEFQGYLFRLFLRLSYERNPRHKITQILQDIINENKQEITKQLQEFDQELQVKSVHHAILTLEAWKSIGHMVAVPTIEYPPMSTELNKNKALSLYADIKRGGNH